MKSPKATQHQVSEIMQALRDLGTKEALEGMVRFGISSDHALGVTIPQIRLLAKRVKCDHELAAGLWATECYEARMIASIIDDPALVTSRQMDQWSSDFDNWAICDGVCYNLFNRTPHAWFKIHDWSTRESEFQKRAAFALLWCQPNRKSTSHNAEFLKALPLVEREADDPRRYVQKAVNMALRSIGKRNPELNAAAVSTAKRLSNSNDKSARWIGTHALRELSSSKVLARLRKS